MAVLVTAVLLWAVVFGVLKAAEHLSGGKIAPYLSSRDIKLHFCFVSFHTTLLNSPIEALARRRRSLLTYWFSVGVLFGLVGLLLSLVLLSSNVYLALLDAFNPLPTPPAPLRPPGAPPPPHHAAESARALARATLRGPSARIPFLHSASRPWWVPAPYWRRVAPHDHAAWHTMALADATRHASDPVHLQHTRRYSVPYGHFAGRFGRRGPGGGPHGPRGPHGPHGPRGPHGPHGRRHRHHHHHGHPPPPRHSPVPEGHPLPPDPPPGGPHRPCKNRPPQTRWYTPLQALPPPDDEGGTPGPRGRVVMPPHAETPEETAKGWAERDGAAEERDLLEHGEKSEITITWRRPPSVASRIPFVSRRLINVSAEEHPALPGGPLPHQNAASRSSFLTPLVPGVTVPPGDLWYMIAAVLVAAVFHELGHALAAGMQNARVSGVGGFVALALPGAYVQLTGIEDLSVFAQLRVYCAGAWHNLVAALLALVAVGWLPLLMSGVYHTSSGALVVSVPELSALLGHVEPGDVILRLGRFDVSDGGPSFRRAVSNLILTNDTVGFCVSENMYRNYSRPRSTCCDDAVMQDLDTSAEMRDKCFRVQGIEKRKSCIDTAVVSTQPTCRFTLDCSGTGLARGPGGVPASPGHSHPGVSSVRMDAVSRAAAPVLPDIPAPNGVPPDPGGEQVDGSKTSCFIPVLPRQQQLVDVRVKGARTGEIVHFFYQGYPEVLGQSVTVSSYVPRIWSMAPHSFIQVLALMDIPNMIERLLQYLSSISLALAILNMAPVFFLDGEVSSVLFVQLLAPRMSQGSSAIAKQIIVCTGSVLLVLNMLTSLLEVEKWH